MRSPPKGCGSAITLAAVATGGLLWLSGCSSSGNPDMAPADMRTPGDLAGQPDMTTEPGAPTKAASAASPDRPLAAVLSPDGKTVYFTGHDANLLAQLYSVPAAGGTPALIMTGIPLIHPLGLGISPDGKTLYIVDGAGGAEDAGTVYTSDTSGNLGNSPVTGIRGPAGVAATADSKSILITGYDAANGKPGVFTASASGGAAVPFVEGTPFVGPSAITIGTDGTVYVVDTTALGPKSAAVIKIVGTTPSVLTTTPLTVGFPAGIALGGIGSPTLLVTGNTGLGNGVVYQVSTTAGTANPISLGMTFFDPATIHRAASAEAWVLIDSVTPMQTAPNQLGQIFTLTP